MDTQANEARRARAALALERYWQTGQGCHLEEGLAWCRALDLVVPENAGRGVPAAVEDLRLQLEDLARPVRFERANEEVDLAEGMPAGELARLRARIAQ